MPSSARRAMATVAVCSLVLAVAGCGTSGGLGNTPAPVILIVSSLLAANAPFGDILSTDGTLPEDSVSVTLIARMKNPSDLSQPALQDILLERYEVTFNRTDGGTVKPPGFQRALSAKVRVTPHGSPTETITGLTLVLVPSTHKSQPPLSHLILPGFEPVTGFVNIQATATVRFFGHTIAGDVVQAEAAIGLNFADFAD